MRGLPELMFGVRGASGNISLGTNTETETSSFLFYFLSPYVKLFRLKCTGGIYMVVQKSAQPIECIIYS